jgi:hypothetical protein
MAVTGTNVSVTIAVLTFSNDTYLQVPALLILSDAFKNFQDYGVYIE